MNKLTRSIKLFTFSLLLIFTQQGLMAHHSAIAFDKTKSVTVSGKITRSVWRNPHMAINIEVPGNTDSSVLWKIEGQYEDDASWFMIDDRDQNGKNWKKNDVPSKRFEFCAKFPMVIKPHASAFTSALLAVWSHAACNMFYE